MTAAENGQEQLGRALACFLAAYQAQPQLVAEQGDWSPVIALGTADGAQRIAVSLTDGRIAAVHVGDDVGAVTAGATLEITAALGTLCDVLTLRRDPNEPYLFGELVVKGVEADFVRLDYIASRLCPR